MVLVDLLECGLSRGMLLAECHLHGISELEQGGYAEENLTTANAGWSTWDCSSPLPSKGAPSVLLKTVLDLE